MASKVAVISGMIAGAGKHEDLKKAGLELFNAKLTKEERNNLVKEYREKRRVLDRAYVEASNNTVMNQCLFQINNMTKQGADHVKTVGKILYAIVKEGTAVNKVEADILFRAYDYQKFKAGISFKPAEAAA